MGSFSSSSKPKLGFALLLLLTLSLLSVNSRAAEEDDEFPSPMFSYQYLGTIELKDSAFVYVNRFMPSEAVSLWITTFSGDPLQSDEIFYVDDFADIVSKGDAAINATIPKAFTSSVTWPNQALAAPYEVFNAPVLVAAGGFLVPGKSTGGIYLFNLNNGQSVMISTEKFGWFYHRTVFLDVDGDGYQDIISARATKPILFGSAASELVWLKNPGGNKQFEQAWTETVIITDGPDFLFRLADIDSDGNYEILAAQYLNPGFYVYWTTSTWESPNGIQKVAVDTTLGSMFDVNVVDLNGDGSFEVMVTNHVNQDTDGAVSGVWAYELPAGEGAWKTQPWTRHTIASDFPTYVPGPGQASPGEAVAFFPVQNATAKPWILLGGDGDEAAYLISPVSESASNWTYVTERIIDVGATVGEVAAFDFENDGYSEFLIPDYGGGRIYVYTFNPNGPL